MPYLAGRRRLGLTWISDAWGILVEDQAEVGKKSQVVGYTYYASFAGVVCLGPVHALHGIWIAEELVWKGPLSAGTDDFTEITVEGRGSLILYWGTEAQTPDPTLAASGVVHPGYRGQCYAVFDDWVLGENRSQVPAVEFDVTRLPATALTVEAVLNGEVHPLVALEELLLNRRFGAGLDPALLDYPSWNLAAEHLADEGFSVSVFLDQANALDALIANFLEYLDAALVQTASGKLALRLLRGWTARRSPLTVEHPTDPPDLTAHGWRDSQQGGRPVQQPRPGLADRFQ
ncbi:MAG: hypothetical protein IPM17_15515 [Verrucomicrobia bacterium]|nr:hypothetical protein [Verrucomicrobiota bacterium]